MGNVRVEGQGRVAVVTLDRPPVNALDHETFLELTRTFRAFARGRRSRSLYGEALTEELLATPVRALRDRLPVAAGAPDVTVGDRLAFAATAIAGLVTLVGLIVFLPLVLIAGLLMQ